ncbi:hypothetical protein CHUAL_002056 [Chamberlinius hualienensis]
MWFISCFLGFLFLLYTKEAVLCLRLTKMEVPEHSQMNKSASLRCLFDMEGADLYSVKWYKDNAEFYRYLPKDNPPQQVYEVTGVNVDSALSGEKVVVLKNVNLQSAGHYRCEVSAEAPSFATVHDEGEMNVIVVPQDSPQITGANNKNYVGDVVSINCTSYKSKPVAMLTWTVNSLKAPKEFLIEYPVTVDENTWETSVLGLTFQIKESHFIDGVMKLKCSATIAPDYHNSNEVTVFGGNLQAAVLESKETPPRHGN